MYRFFFQAEDGIRDSSVTGVQTCALPILHGAELGEVGTLTEVCGWSAVDAQDASVVQRDEIAAPQSREAHPGIALGGQIAVGGTPYGAAVGGGVEPAGDGSQGNSSRSIPCSLASVIRKRRATTDDGGGWLYLAPHAPRSHP